MFFLNMYYFFLLINKKMYIVIVILILVIFFIYYYYRNNAIDMNNAYLSGLNTITTTVQDNTTVETNNAISKIQDEFQKIKN